ncbi:flagellar biosynthetic protein FliR [Terrarubrum flagellatum]|uniref:flagellar biosynthetic protein FliR n=1 Tax=Terrirubrum flagellatum TaxID=2895980 RepID=UPI003144E881
MTLLPEWATAFMLTFARVGVLVMLLPGLGERAMPTRLRLSSALLLTLTFLPIAQPLIPQGAPLATLFIELAIGFTLGFMARLMVSALQTAGVVIAQDIGLSFAQSVDPTAGSQGTAIANLLTLLGATLVFTSDLHHLAISAIGASYTKLPPGALPDASDAVRMALSVMATSFSLAVKIAAPFAVFAIVFNLGLGLLSRMMPALQVFFLALPASVLLGMLMLLGVLAIAMGVYLDELGRLLAVLNGR